LAGKGRFLSGRDHFCLHRRRFLSGKGRMILAIKRRKLRNFTMKHIESSFKKKVEYRIMSGKSGSDRILFSQE
jgi:hypothetical protein